uniref:Uncharacterized protein n=1 Tax=Rhizophora mucronata TaxID=61149 RepID=A0A2P2NL21_RHIMU
MEKGVKKRTQKHVKTIHTHMQSEKKKLCLYIRQDL